MRAAKKQKTPKGSIYMVVKSRSEEWSFVFQAQARNITFEDWNSSKNIYHWLESHDRTTDMIGYYEIMVDLIKEGSMSCPVPVGVFVLRRASLTTVAEDLRRRFGQHTALFRESQ